MKPGHTLLLQTTLGAFALAGAFYAGRNSVEPAAPPGAKTTAMGTKSNTPRTVRENKESRLDSAQASIPQESEGTVRGAGEVSLSPDQAAPRFKAIMENPDPIARMGEYLAFLGTLKTNEARQAALESLMDGFDFRQRGRELTLLMSAWAQADTPAALAAASERKDQTGMHTINLVLSQWAKKDPDQAMAWAAENGKKMNQTMEGNWYMASVLGAMAKTDPDRAASLAQTAMNRSQARGQALDQIVEQLIEQRGAQAGQAWVASLPEGTFRNGALERVAGHLADKNSSEAATWASSLPDSEGKTRALTAVVEQWAEENPRDAGAWLNQLPVSETTDAPRERFVWKVAEEDPVAAVSWAATITDEKLRSTTTTGVLKNWIEREPEKAREWLAASNLPEDVKQRFTGRKR